MRSGIENLFVKYGDGPNGLEQEVRAALLQSFRPILSGNREPSPPADVADDPARLADRLAGIIFGFSRKTAVAGGTNPKGAEGIRPHVFEFVQRGLPVEIQLLWSPKKHWVQMSESAVDLAELAALQTLLSIDWAVRRVYPPGTSFAIDAEDIEFQFMEGQTADVVNAQEIYISGMARLVVALGLEEVFTVRRMSTRAKDAEELRQWQVRLAENHRALEAYWYDSEKCPVSSWETLSSFKEIQRLGWNGTIPMEMRRYYLNRLEKLAAPHQSKVDMILRNFSGILLHYQAGLLRGSGAIQPVKFSFVRAADAAPAKLLTGRVDIRFAPRKLCSRVSAAAPWATKGFVQNHGQSAKITFRGWHELNGSRRRFSEGWLNIPGQIGGAKIRCDFLHDE